MRWIVPNKSSSRDGRVIGFMYIEGECFVKNGGIAYDDRV